MTDDRKLSKDLTTEGKEDDKAPSQATTNWQDLRDQAAKLGITLSELQQRQRQQRLKQKAKEDVRSL